MGPEPYVQVSLVGHDLGSEGTDFRISGYEGAGAPLQGVRRISAIHRHRSEDEAWYVLSGRLRFQFGTEEGV